MSTTYFTWAIPVRARDLPHGIRSFDDVSPFDAAALLEALQWSSASYDPIVGPATEEEGDGPVCPAPG